MWVPNCFTTICWKNDYSSNVFLLCQRYLWGSISGLSIIFLWPICYIIKTTLLLLFFIFPVVYGRSQARGQIGAAPASLHHRPQMWDSSATYTIAGPGIKPASSLILAGFISTEPRQFSLKSFLSFLDMSPLLDVWFADIFSHSMGCLFIFLAISFKALMF